VPALSAVLDAIARAVLGSEEQPAVVLGSVTLLAHQLEALRRVQASIASVGGALLADEPGLGKTFVALALAVDSPATIVVAPAALRSMWRDAASRAGVLVAFVSMETLSRRDFEHHEGDGLVIVDEAHHVSNPTAKRYARLARLTAYKKVLLLSATPVRNRQGELGALLALFMGPRAHGLDDAERSQCIVRRAGDASLRPEIDGPHWHRVRSIPRVGKMIAKLPPPLPALDGREASALLCMTLARCWASSLAALDAALRRRIQRGAALAAILDSGRVPTRAELRAWVVGDDSVQLAFPMFAAKTTSDAARLRETLDRHLCAVRELRDAVRPRVGPDARERAWLLLHLRDTHPVSRIVAFSAHAATAEALYGVMSRERGIALLTSRGARTAGGARPRTDVIEALASNARRSARDEISLVVTTDLLSEGVNLQGASVIVHLDVPWTPAGLDQRVGRAARMGSSHSRVYVHGFAPPAAAERLLSLDRRFTQKRAARSESTRSADALEQLRKLVRPWLGTATSDDSVAHVTARQSGFIAVIERTGSVTLACGACQGGRWRINDSPRALLRSVGEICATQIEPDASFERGARIALERWLASRRARESTGAENTPSRARRALLTQIDSLSLQAAAHSRAAQAERIACVRGLVDQAISAGAERILVELTRATEPNLESLLTACESRLTGTAITAPNSRSQLRALLLLRGPV